MDNQYPVREEGSSKNNQPERLPDDITLHFRSISLADGYAGAEVVFQPTLHRAYHYSYVLHKKSFILRLIDKLKKRDGVNAFCDCQYAEVPASIVSRQAAEEFLRTNYASWFF